MIKLLSIELFKIFHKPRTFIAFAVITVIILLIQIGFKFGGEEYTDIMMGGLKETFEVPVSQILNGYLVCFIILNLLLIHVPILVALVAGDAVAGEANMGTLRLLVSKPLSRTRLLIIKFIASAIYTLLLLLWVAVLSFFLSLFFFITKFLVFSFALYLYCIYSQCVLWLSLAS